METYFNAALGFVCLVVLLQFLEHSIRRLASAPLTLTDDDLQDMVDTANRVPSNWRARVRDAQLLAAILIMLPIFVGLCFPLIMDSQAFHQHWPDFVLQLPTLVWLLALLPGIILSFTIGLYIAIKLSRLAAIPFTSTRSSLFVEFVNSGFIDDDGNYRVSGDAHSWLRSVTFWTFGIYLFAVALVYLTADVLTTSHYHQRGLFLWLNKEIPHEQLSYIVDEDSGLLEISNAADGVVLRSTSLLGGSEAQMQRALTSIDEKTNATWIRK